MSDFFRRSNIHIPEPGENENKPSVTGETEPRTISEGGKTYSLLITAQDNTEEAYIESVLRSAGIPYVLRDSDGESWMRVIMGFNIYGADFFVPAELLDDAAALLVPEADEAPSDGGNKSE